MTQQTTIAAIATPPGIGGIGIVRLSGPKAKQVLKSLWKNRQVPVDSFATHRIYYGNIVDSSTGLPIDNCLCVWMKGPHSYTGEDVIEIQGHGSPLLMEKILEGCVKAGAQLAAPGEFTKRAYLNGKLALSQAEAVADVIHASSESGLKQAREHLAGDLSKRILEFQQELVRLRAFVEASIDFPEDDLEMIHKEGILTRLAPIQMAMTELLKTYHSGRLHREGVRTVLVGRPNAGKSSLLNTLLGVNRAIVHHTPGTTRDVIEESCQLGGSVFRLYDTAGLRDSLLDEVEAIGVSRSEELLKNADLILWVIDGSTLLSKEDIDYLSKLDVSKTILCINKTDLSVAWNPQALLLGKEQETLVSVSALRGDGIQELQEKMVAWIKKKGPQESTGLQITKLRHKDAIERSLQELNETAKALQEKTAVELVAFHLRKAHAHLGEITGSNVSEDLLNTLFSEFCIGK